MSRITPAYWKTTLEELSKENYETIIPLVNAFDEGNEDYAVEHFDELTQQFDEIQQKWKNKVDVEEILDKVMNRIIQTRNYINSKQGVKKTKFDYAKDIAEEKNWSPVLDLINKIIKTYEDGDRYLTEEMVKDIEENFKELQEYITREIGVGYRGFINNEINKKIKFYHTRLERDRVGDFSSWLKTTRKQKKLTLAELAERAGVSASYIHRMEKGARNIPTLPVIEKLAKGLNFTPEYLISVVNQYKEEDKQAPDIKDLITLNSFTIEGETASQKQKQLLIDILDKIIDEDWEDGDIWTKGGDLLKIISKFKDESLQFNK